MTPCNPFAASAEGQRLAMLNLAGYPLAGNQADLTPAQVVFLEAALPIALRKTQGAGQGQADGQEGTDPQLKRLARARFRGR